MCGRRYMQQPWAGKNWDAGSVECVNPYIYQALKENAKWIFRSVLQNSHGDLKIGGLDCVCQIKLLTDHVWNMLTCSWFELWSYSCNPHRGLKKGEREKEREREREGMKSTRYSLLSSVHKTNMYCNKQSISIQVFLARMVYLKHDI